MTNYIIAIPSYNRPELIKKKTLNFLNNNMINPSQIYIFVANPEEKKKYINSLDMQYWESIIVGVPGLLQQRKFISNYFKDDQWIFQMDDDVDELWELTDNKDIKFNSEPFRDLNSFIYSAFKECIKCGTKIWGVYPCDNTYFMRFGISTNLRLIVGCCFGIINDKQIENNINICEKEDYERSILYYKKYSCVMRYNYIGVQTNYFKNKGGLQSLDLNYDRIVEAEKSTKYLLNKYPAYCKRRDKKNISDIRLILNPIQHSSEPY